MNDSSIDDFMTGLDMAVKGVCEFPESLTSLCMLMVESGT